MKLGACRYELTIAPVSGKAIPVYRGETLRILQTRGEQCVDFNCFNLHDYKERMSVSHMRAQGFRVKQGHLVLSAAPHCRPMMLISSMSETCVTDLLAARCDATMGEREFNLVPRTNCQDTFSEAVREFGLSPDDVHDSLNMWMHTCWGDSFRILPNVAPAGDHVDLLALMDVLAVPIICGSGDLGQVSNFNFSPIEVKIFEASEESKESAKQCLERSGLAGSEVTKLDRRRILTQRELVRDSNYKSRRFPVSYTDVEVEFADGEIDRLKNAPQIARAGDVGDRARMAFMLWYQSNRLSRS
ncbi:MAG: DUF1989 domain-containing protein [Pseudorhodoplanes sp.]|uniref:DUF1989 domain-containing protein n=1 Tax=Pseudorhodoplanes sp. TaxID=1934341 RepID=UPI003D11594C